MVLEYLYEGVREEQKGMISDLERYIAVSITNQYIISLQSLAQKAKDKLKSSKEYIAQRLDEIKRDLFNMYTPQFEILNQETIYTGISGSKFYEFVDSLEKTITALEKVYGCRYACYFSKGVP
jgi:hypothetical protein